MGQFQSRDNKKKKQQQQFWDAILFLKKNQKNQVPKSSPNNVPNKHKHNTQQHEPTSLPSLPF